MMDGIRVALLKEVEVLLMNLCAITTILRGEVPCALSVDPPTNQEDMP